MELMASSSSSHQQNRDSNAFSGIEPAGIRTKVSESSRLFDVFINHRGPDVKQTLATELYNSLGQLGIHAFLDSEEKELGDSFTSTIETAIRSAKVHIAIFSKRYAESPWCLAELVLMRQTEAKIIPVFYEVEPGDLRYIEKGAYADAFRKYKEKNRYLEKLDEWKKALQTLSFIAGEVFHGDCKTIVAAAKKEVQRKRCLCVAKYPVGLNNLVKDFESRCLDELVKDFENQCSPKERKDKPNIVSIFGMCGVGKTTLAKELFNRKRSDYSGASFLFDVREASVRRELPRLQSQLVKDLFDREENFRSTEEGTSYLNYQLERCHCLNFLIVVDDIDHVEQLDALLIMDILNKSDNSLIIVTTRDVGVVISAGISIGYPLKGMNRNNGRELFCWHAFDHPLPCAGYEALVDQFVDICGGLPLSLLVLGRLVHGRDHGFWESNLIKAKKMLPRDVKQRLRISFDSLEDEEKQVFMDIACFFLGKPKRMAEIICEGSGWDAQNALQTLKDKCLLEEEEDWYGSPVLRMHDYLRDLGREMAGELSSPRRLWHPRDLESLELKDLQTVLAETNSRCFHSIFEDSIKSEVTFFLGQSDSCGGMPASLLWLELQGTDDDESHGEENEENDDEDDITEQLMIPSWIPLQNLQFLKIFGGRFKTLRENRRQIFPYQHQLSTSCRDLQGVSGIADPLKLRELIISDCPELEELPVLFGVSCMEKIVVEACDKLQNITLPQALISLSVRRCRDLQRVVRYGDLTKLTELIIRECPELEELLVLSGVSCMEKIEIDSCEKLQNITLPTTLISLSVRRCRDLRSVVGYSELTKLTELIISDCPELEELPSLFKLSCMKLPSLSRVSCMEKIEIDSCDKLQAIMLPTALISLSVKSCRDLERVSESGDLIRLRELIIRNCPELEELPDLAKQSSMEKIEIDSCDKLQTIMLPKTLISLSVQNCRDLQRVIGSSDLIELTKLIICECPKLEELPGFSRMSCVEKIEIHCCEKLQNITLPATLTSLSVRSCRDLQRVEGTDDLMKLEEFEISDCGKLEFEYSWEDKEHAPLQLRKLIICGTWSASFEGFPSSISYLKSLKKIALLGDAGKQFGIKVLPDEFCDLQSLEHLELRHCTLLSSLPAQFGDLRNLQHLDLCYCKALRNLPYSFQQLKHLKHLDLSGCKRLVLQEGTLGDITQLENLNLSGCLALQHIPDQITGQACLTDLQLQNTSLEDLPKNIGQLRKLEVLTIGSPLMKSLPDSLGNLSSLKSLSITDCFALESLPKTLGNLVVLEHLCIESSGVMSLPEGFRRLANLRTLKISDCQLSELDFGSVSSFSLEKLTEINLRATLVTRISISDQCCPRLETLRLSKNDNLEVIETVPATVNNIELSECETLKNIKGILALPTPPILRKSYCPELEES